MGLTYQQGDKFEFLGPAGRPGMKRTQLAHAVCTAANVNGRYTVEITGSGRTGLDDSTVYEELVPDSNKDVPSAPSNEDIMSIHFQAIKDMKKTAIAASIGGIVLIFLFGWIQGIVSLLVLDALLVYIWSIAFVTRQI